MSAFAGVVALDGAGVDSRAENSTSRAIAAVRGGRTVTRRIAGAAFVQRSSQTGTGLGDVQPLTEPDGRVLFAAHARLDNREELRSALGLSRAELATTRDARLILSMHQRWGDGGVARCLGAFAFARWDGAAAFRGKAASQARCRRG